MASRSKATQSARRVKMTPRTPRYKQLSQVALLLTDEQIAFLDELEHQITQRRRDLVGQDVTIAGKPVTKDRRITKNALIRCLIDLLQEQHGRLVLDNVINETDLNTSLKTLLK